MKYLLIILVSMLTMLTFAFAQEEPKPSEQNKKDSPPTEVQKDKDDQPAPDMRRGGRGFRGGPPDMGRGGRGFRGGPDMEERRNVEFEKLRKELFDCPVCQEHRKHMTEVHGINPWGPRGPLGKMQPSRNNEKFQKVPVNRGPRFPRRIDDFPRYRNICDGSGVCRFS
jgi:hypothetical protein